MAYEAKVTVGHTISLWEPHLWLAPSLRPWSSVGWLCRHYDSHVFDWFNIFLCSKGHAWSFPHQLARLVVPAAYARGSVARSAPRPHDQPKDVEIAMIDSPSLQPALGWWASPLAWRRHDAAPAGSAELTRGAPTMWAPLPWTVVPKTSSTSPTTWWPWRGAWPRIWCSELRRGRSSRPGPAFFAWCKML